MLSHSGWASGVFGSGSISKSTLYVLYCILSFIHERGIWQIELGNRYFQSQCSQLDKYPGKQNAQVVRTHFDHLYNVSL